MASLFHQNASPSILIVPTLILLLRFVPSTVAAKGFREIICTRTSNPSSCLTLDPVRNAQSTRDLSKGAIDLALIRANEIHSQLNQNYAAATTESFDGRLKDSYLICSKNYNDAIRDLTIAQRLFDNNGQFGLIPFELNDAQDELKSCGNVFSASTADVNNIRQTNEDLYLLIQIAQISSQIIAKNY